MKRTGTWQSRAALALVATGCNSLLDIETRELVPADAGDASSAASHDVTSDATSSHQTLPIQTEGAQHDASVTFRDESTDAPSSAAVGSSRSDPGSTLDAPLASDSTFGSSAPLQDARDAEPAAPNLEAAVGCASRLDAWGHTTFCRFTPNGFDRNGNPLTDVGDVHLWIYWSDSAVDGWVCVIDDADNGRGLAYRVLVHPTGAELPSLPSDDVTPEGAWVLVSEGRDNERFGTCSWVQFGTAQQGDQVMVEWLDLWTTRHFDGRYVVARP